MIGDELPTKDFLGLSVLHNSNLGMSAVPDFLQVLVVSEENRLFFFGRKPAFVWAEPRKILSLEISMSDGQIRPGPPVYTERPGFMRDFSGNSNVKRG